MSAALRAVLFDLDGTLLDTAPDMAAALNRLRREQGLADLPFERVRPQVSNGARALVQLGFGLSEDAPGFERLRQRFLQLYHEGVCLETRPFPGIEELLLRLEALRLPWGVVTNKPGWLTLPLLQALQLAQRAAVIVSGDTTLRRKPHPDPLLYACRALGLGPASCVYVGDAARDVEAALRAGMLALAATFGYIPEGEDPASWGAHELVTHPDAIWQHIVPAAA